MHLCKNCVHRGFLSCLKVKRSCKVGGEVCLTILFNLFGENRKGAGRAHIWSSLWLLLWKQLISFVFFFLLLEKVKTDIWGKKSQTSCCKDTWWNPAGVSCSAQAQGKAGLGKSPCLLQLRLEPQRGQGGAPGSFQGPSGAELQLLLLGRGGDEIIPWKGEKSRESEGMKTQSFAFIPLIFSGIPLGGWKPSLASLIPLSLCFAGIYRQQKWVSNNE